MAVAVPSYLSIIRLVFPSARSFLVKCVGQTLGERLQSQFCHLLSAHKKPVHPLLVIQTFHNQIKKAGAALGAGLVLLVKNIVHSGPLNPKCSIEL